MKTFLILTLLGFSLSRTFAQCESFADAFSWDASAYGVVDGMIGAGVNFPVNNYTNDYWTVTTVYPEVLITEGPFQISIQMQVPTGSYWVSISASWIEPFSQQQYNCYYEEMVTVGQPSCMLSDLNVDYAVNSGDLLLFTPAFGCTTNCGNADMNADGVVNIGDMLLFLSEYGNACWGM